MNNCGISRVSYAEPSDGELSYETAEAEIICVNDVSHLSEIS
jgi:hypothetical protein